MSIQIRIDHAHHGMSKGNTELPSCTQGFRNVTPAQPPHRPAIKTDLTLLQKAYQHGNIAQQGPPPILEPLVAILPAVEVAGVLIPGSPEPLLVTQQSAGLRLHVSKVASAVVMRKVAKGIAGGGDNLFQITRPQCRKTTCIVGHHPHSYSPAPVPRRHHFARLTFSPERSESATRLCPGSNVAFHLGLVFLPIINNQPVVTDFIEPVKSYCAIGAINPGTAIGEF